MTTHEPITEGLDLGNSVKVYLDWNDEKTAWELCPISMDGGPLDTDHGVEGDLDRSQWTAADRAAANRADTAQMPTGEELIKLLAQYLPEPTQNAINSNANALKRAAENGSNDEHIEALRDQLELFASILGFDEDAGL